MKLSRRIKNAKRTKRTKRTKRKNHTKLRRKTKQQFRQYRRKNTYHKHSHKLKQNKRVHRGGEGKKLLDDKACELQYTTDDSSWINIARGAFNKSQTGKFKCTLKHMTTNINENSFNNPAFTTVYTDPVSQPFVIGVDSNDTYIFELTMTKDAGKTFQVTFTVIVNEYELTNRLQQSSKISKPTSLQSFTDESRQSLLLKLTNPNNRNSVESSTSRVFSVDKLQTSTTYTSPEDSQHTFDLYTGEKIFTAVINKKTYKFPYSMSESMGNSIFFHTVARKMSEYIKQEYQEKINEMRLNTLNTQALERQEKHIRTVFENANTANAVNKISHTENTENTENTVNTQIEEIPPNAWE